MPRPLNSTYALASVALGYCSTHILVCSTSSVLVAHGGSEPRVLDFIPQHVHALVVRVDKLLDLLKTMLVRGKHELRVNEVERAAVTVEVGDEFFGKHSHKLGVEAGLKGEVAIVR